MSDLDRDRRREIARQALDASGFPGIDDDPYWLCNLKGRVTTADLHDQAEQLLHDADVLSTAALKIDEGELLPEEAALYIAERVHHGDYETDDHLYDELPIQSRGERA